jgi:ribonuclease J
VIHSGDFKIDERPVRGPGMDQARLAALGQAGVRLLLSDSTNAERPGWALSESAVGPGLHDVMAEATGRVFVATFSSNAHRLQQVVEAAAASGRRLALLGRGMVENFEIARVLGQVVEPGWMPVTTDEARRVPPRELAVLTTGSQGEPRAALGRLARGEHADLTVHAGDTVVLSSRQIPGNELAVGRLVNELCARGALIRWDGHPPLHATGHAQEAEQRRLIQLTRPERFMPVHGEYRQLARHAAHAAAEGIPAGRCHLLTDGQVLELDDAGARTLPDRVQSGRIAIVRDDGASVEVPDAVLEDRRRLAEFGLCVVVVQVDAATGEVLARPELHARGVAGLEGREAELHAEVLAALAEAGSARGEPRREALRLSVRRWFRRATGRRPLVEPVVIER